ncbi:hypothetical protein SERLADRAFT_436049 [Serpula lacrymans var. lacrymans S7.9]|uniref:Uncharacterized protein n=1 Tax=Serpula lacrymans var. lacrymans (strain S7.9) TaxID=578457 RepID=F8NR43_SERL9|nr:uncharacterized protein SERLADRAFT_436049 [Serpula lacrymans var. lacrymans S7.9]EGO26216.1 hypothetical protein SERLADRAFT_436049 [Serpula lacrymans var. lacrymans S7.9]
MACLSSIADITVSSTASSIQGNLSFVEAELDARYLELCKLTLPEKCELGVKDSSEEEKEETKAVDMITEPNVEADKGKAVTITCSIKFAPKSCPYLTAKELDNLLCSPKGLPALLLGSEFVVDSSLDI